MKRFFTLCMALLLMLGLASCGTQIQTQGQDDDALTIVTTIFPPYDFVREISGGKATAIMLLKPGAESHSFDPTPQDMRTIQNADLFIYTGGENDAWLEDLLEALGDEMPDTLRLLDCVDTVQEEHVEGMQSSHDHDDADDHDTDDHDTDDHDTDDHDADDHDTDDHDESIDEHVWTSPKNAIALVQAISAEMQARDAAHAALYAQNTAEYVAKLTQLDTDYTALMHSAARNTVVFADRFPFRYLADAYGLEYYAAFSGCSTETEASAATVAFLIRKIEEEQLPAVFTIEFSNQKIAHSLADATGAQIYQLHSCHNLTRDEMNAGETYLSLMRQNLQNLQEALG